MTRFMDRRLALLQIPPGPQQQVPLHLQLCDSHLIPRQFHPLEGVDPFFNPGEQAVENLGRGEAGRWHGLQYIRSLFS
jgi:hypothetical protein